MAFKSSHEDGNNSRVFLRANPAEIKHALILLLCELGGVYELRALETKQRTMRGYFNDPVAMLRAAADLSDRFTAAGVYLTINPVNPDLLARSANQIEGYAVRTTSDAEILRRCWFALDLDPVRPAGISSTDEQHQAALAKGRAVRDALAAMWWPAPILGDSGNGAHLLFRIDLPNDNPSRDLIKLALEASAHLFEDGEVRLDRSVFNAARIWKVYGTVARKGTNLADRPHRLARILEVPDPLATVSREQLAELAARAPSARQSRARSPRRAARQFDLDAFMEAHNIRVKRREPWEGGERLILQACLFDSAHTATSAAILRLAHGAIAYKCQHDSCRERQWRDVLAKYKPDDADAKEATQADVLIELGMAGAKLFHDPETRCYGTVKVADHFETHAVRARTFRLWLLGQYYHQTGQGPSGEALTMALNTLEAIAHFEGEEQPVFVRVAGDTKKKVFVDLCNPQWRVVEIDADGWRVIEAADCPVRFVRRRGSLALPTPTRGGSVELLREFISSDDDDFKLMLGWLIGAYHPAGPFPILEISGDHGSGKTVSARVLRDCVDPNISPVRAEPKDNRDLMIAATAGRVIALDNLSWVKRGLSDALCRLSTGGGLSTRELYSDDEERIFDAKRPIIVTGIGNPLTNPDVLDRTIRVVLEEIPNSRRKKESEFNERFASVHPDIMGAVFDALSCALRGGPETARKFLPRMADAAEWIESAAPALGWKPDEFLILYEQNRSDANQEVIDNSLVARMLLELLDEKNGYWSGTAAELLKELNNKFVQGVPEKWPRTPRAMSGALRRVRPNLKQIGVKIEFDRDPSSKRRLRNIEISREPGPSETV
jgi:hypothetical protein